MQSLNYKKLKDIQQLNSLLAMPVHGWVREGSLSRHEHHREIPTNTTALFRLLSIQFHPVAIVPLKEESPTLLEGCLCLSWPPSCSPCCQWQQAREMRSAQPPTPPTCVLLPVCMGLRDHQGLLGGMGGMGGTAARLVRQLELIWRTSERLFD